MKMRKCCVKGCTSVKRNPKVSFFNAPKANHLAWNVAVSNANREETVVKRVCAEHFRPDDIINTYSIPQDVTNDIGNRTKIGLKKGIVPSIFSSIDKLSNEIVPPVNNFNSDHNYANCSISNQFNKSKIRKLFVVNTSDREVIIEDIEPYKLNEEPPNKRLKSFEENIDDILTFNDLAIHFKRAVLPEGWTSHFSNDEIVFYKPKFIDDKMKIEKQIVFKSTLEICAYVYQFAIQIEKISITLKYPISVTNLSQVIKVLDFKKVCGGGPRSIDFSGVRVKTATLENDQFWRHQKCSILIDRKTKTCSACNFLIKYFKKSLKQKKQSKHVGCTPTKCGIVKNLKRCNTRLRTTITKVNFKLEELQNKLRQYQITEKKKIF